MKIFTLLLIIMSLATATVLAQEETDEGSKPESEVAQSESADSAEKDKKAPAKKKASKVYTWIDEKGNRMYSDTPRDGAEELKIQKSTEYTPPTVASPWQSTPPEVDKKAAYTNFSVISPANDATIRNNQGAFQVAFAIQPQLMPGHQIVLLQNGVEVQRGRTPILSLMNIDRGSHSISGQIVTDTGDVIASSNSITVHLHRATIRRTP